MVLSNWKITQNRIWQRGKRDRPIIQPDMAYVTKVWALYENV